MTDIATQAAASGRPDPLADLREELDALRRDNLYRPLVVMHGPQTKQTTMDGRPVISGYLLGACPGAGKVAVPKDAAVMQVMTRWTGNSPS